MVTIADTFSITDSSLSSTDTIVPEPETESAAMESTEMASRFDEQGTRSAEGYEGAHAAGAVTAAVTGAGPAGSKQAEAETEAAKRKKEDQDHQRSERSEMTEEKHETRKDADADADADKRDDDTLAGLLGVDFERVVAFPLFF